MANQKRGIRENQESDRVRKFLYFATIPLIVLILIIVIIIMDRFSGDMEDDSPIPVMSVEGGQIGDGSWISQEEEHSESEQEEESESSLEEKSQLPQEQEDDSQEAEQRLTDPSGYPFQQDAVLELTGLVQSYCEAKKECDPDLLAWVFHIDDWSEEQKEEERARMELLKASIKSYENISCYSIQGPETDSYVIFPYYEIRYRETETLMPSFSWAYAKKDENGRYYIVQETDGTVNEYIHKVAEKSEVKAVMAQVMAKQQEAVDSDAFLQKIYGKEGESEVIFGGTVQ